MSACIESAVFDIETTHLNADFGIVLCAVIKPAHGEPIIFRSDELNPDWATKRSNDCKLIKKVSETLNEFDLLVAHNGCAFDLPFIRARIAKWELKPLPPIKILDPCLVSRKHLKLSSNSLKCMATFFKVNSKTPVTGDTWLKASLDGCKKSMDYIVKHCVEDVYTLERVVVKVKPYSKVFNSWGSAT